MSRRSPAFVVSSLATALLAVSGCASGTRLVRQRASNDLGCPESSVRVTELGAGGYRASGCGRARSYTCVNRTCVGDSQVASVDPVVHGGTGPGTGLVAATYDEIRACLGGSDEALTLDVAIDDRGTIRPLEIHERVGPREASCISRVARDASNPRWRATARLTLRYPAERPVFETDDEAPRSAPPRQLAAVSPEPPPRSTRAGEPPALRGRIDSRGAAIAACIGDASVVPLVVEWSADGAVTAHVRGREGSVEDACVQALLEGERLDPPPGTAGTLVHVVQAR